MSPDSPTSLGQNILKVILILKLSSPAFPSIWEKPTSFCLKQSGLCLPQLSPEAYPYSLPTREGSGRNPHKGDFYHWHYENGWCRVIIKSRWTYNLLYHCVGIPHKQCTPLSTPEITPCPRPLTHKTQRFKRHQSLTENIPESSYYPRVSATPHFRTTFIDLIIQFSNSQSTS